MDLEKFFLRTESHPVHNLNEEESKQYALDLMQGKVTTCMKCNQELRVEENIRQEGHVNWTLEVAVIYDVDAELLIDRYHCDKCSMYTMIEKIRGNVIDVKFVDRVK